MSQSAAHNQGRRLFPEEKNTEHREIWFLGDFPTAVNELQGAVRISLLQIFFRSLR
jgi:hypothetical protein